MIGTEMIKIANNLVLGIASCFVYLYLFLSVFLGKTYGTHEIYIVGIWYFLQHHQTKIKYRQQLRLIYTKRKISLMWPCLERSRLSLCRSKLKRLESPTTV